MQVYRLINDLSCMPTYVCIGNAGDTVIQQTCDIALSNLRRAREALTARVRESRNESSFSREFTRASPFLGQKRSSVNQLDKRPCKRAARTRTQKFVCLSHCAQDIIPTTDAEKDALLGAGLGEKKIVVENVDCSGEEFCELLHAAFPKLKDSGGFIFAKCKCNSRFLERLSSMCLTSPRALQEEIGNSRTYIIPLERDLDLTPCHLPPWVRLADY